MSFVENDTKIKEIHQCDDDFYISDGIKLVPRAYVEISNMCPANMSLAIRHGIDRGYLKIVACVREKDYVWEKLST